MSVGTGRPSYITAEFSVPAEVNRQAGGSIEVWLLSTVRGGDLDDGATLVIYGASPPSPRHLLAEARVSEADRKALSAIVSGQRLAAGSAQPAGPRSGVVLLLGDADGQFCVEFADEEHADEWAAEHTDWIGDAFAVVPMLTKADAIARASRG